MEEKKYLEALSARDFFAEAEQCYLKIKAFKRKIKSLEDEKIEASVLTSQYGRNGTGTGQKSGPEATYMAIMEKQDQILNMLQEELCYWENIRLETEKALAELDVEEAEVLSMKYLEGMSYKEIMFALKMSRATFNRRLRDGLAKFAIPCVEDPRTYREAS